MVIMTLLSLMHAMTFADELAKPLADNPALESQVMEIAVKLRCLVCQNETIAGSHADLAIDLRNQIRDQLIQGKSDQEILAYMVQRYGDFVLYKPPVQSNTLFLWFGPIILLLIGITVLIRHVLKQKRMRVKDVVTPEDLAHARSLLTEHQKDTP
jgi:cytochrome c-type biogenesis protein CcmH